jgi:hypothetical protein
MIMNKVEQLEQEIHEYQQQIEELHIYEPNEFWYKQERERLEYLIASLEDEIKRELRVNKEEANVSMIFLIVLYALVVIGLGILIFM